MRFQQFVERDLVSVVRKKYQEINTLVDLDHQGRANGGWEVWLQVEMFLELYRLNEVIDFVREPFYESPPNPRNQYRADFYVVPRNARTTKTWVELKTQRKADNTQQPIHGFADDVIKISNYISVKQNDSVGAIVVIPKNARYAIYYAQRIFESESNKIITFFVNNQDLTIHTCRLNEIDPKEVPEDTDPLIMYYIKS